MKSYKITDDKGNIWWHSKESIRFVDRHHVEFVDGEICYKFIYLHREDGPAIEHVSGEHSFYINGNLHRENGPAVEWRNYNVKLWYWHGEWLRDIATQKEFEIWKRFRNFK